MRRILWAAMLVAAAAGCIGDGDPVYMYSVSPEPGVAPQVVLEPADAEDPALAPLVDLLERANGTLHTAVVSLAQAEAAEEALRARGMPAGVPRLVGYGGVTYSLSFLSGS